MLNLHFAPQIDIDNCGKNILSAKIIESVSKGGIMMEKCQKPIDKVDE